MELTWRGVAVRGAAVIALGPLTVFGSGQAGSAAEAVKAPVSGPGPLVQRRLSPDQYRKIIADVFGPSITFGGRFEPDVREGGLMAIGSGKVGITAKGMEEYDGMARNIAAQVVSEKIRGTLIPCTPADAKAADFGECAAAEWANAGLLS